jgi:hypothetical protein
MVFLGALMVASPILAAVLERDVVNPFDPPKPARIVPTIPEPNYQAFVFEEDMSYLDLRTSFAQTWYSRLPGWKLLAGPRPRIRPATLTNEMRVRKVAAADKLYLTYTTSGNLDLRCLTHACDTEVATQDGQLVGELIADVRNVPVGSDFTIITEVTYWNAFSGRRGDNYTTYTHNQGSTTEKIGAVVIFPDKKPFAAISVTSTTPGEKTARPFSGVATANPGPGNRTYYWRTESAGGIWLYTFNWAW